MAHYEDQSDNEEEFFHDDHDYIGPVPQNRKKKDTSDWVGEASSSDVSSDDCQPSEVLHSHSGDEADEMEMAEISPMPESAKAEQNRKLAKELPMKSPLLTMFRDSMRSMDDVSLAHSVQSQDGSELTVSEGGLLSPVQRMPPTRKFSDAFSWFSRKTPTLKKQHSSSSAEPSKSATSLMSPLSTFEISANTIKKSNTANDSPQKKSSFSLKDRFKQARLRDELGADVESQGDNDSSASVTGDSSTALSPYTPSVSDVISPTDTGTRNISASPAEMQPAADAEPSPDVAQADGPVDWDLWQQVVYEGPVAVARHSPDELSLAIATGIPSAIRGVVWQVLAQSKNEELENVYRKLVAREAHPVRRRSGLSIRMPTFRAHDSSPVRSERSRRSTSISSSTSSLHSALSRSRSSSIQSIAESPLTGGDSTDSKSIDTGAAVSRELTQKQKDESAELQKLEKAIRRDLGARTSYSKFLMSDGLQEGLFGICKAYALFDSDVGYAQGMNFIVMPLLFNMPEEEAFCLFVRLMNQYKLRNLFIKDMPGLHLHLYQFERLLEDLEPAVYCHLNRRGVTPQLYATQWFLTLFAYRFPLQLVLRIYDLVLSEGLEGAILKFGIVLMQKNAQKLLELKDMAVLTTFLKERLFDVYIDKAPSASSILDSGFFGRASGVDNQIYRADELVKDACSVEVTPAKLKIYTNEWEEKCRDTKQKQAEEDSLRASNAALTLEVHTLRERVERSDVEHVQVASDLVRVKVENERLSDDMESLRTHVQELQNIIQSQPDEVENKLKEEMERIMKRNIEVQNENRSLEDTIADMEKELVGTKIRNAEVHSELEDMRGKWNNITSMMNLKVSPS